MKRIATYASVVVCLFIVSSAEAAIFNIANVTDLQNALTTAQANGQDDTINLAPGIYAVGSTLSYYPGESENFSLTIHGAGSGATILDGGSSISILEIELSNLLDGNNANVAIRGVTFRNGSERSSFGGAVYIGNYYAHTTVEDSVFQDNTSSYGGGALYLSGWSATLAMNTFARNTTTGTDSKGGAVHTSLFGGWFTLEGNAFSNNSSSGAGAGIYATSTGGVDFIGNTFNNNAAGREGGGVCIDVGSGNPVTVSGNTFHANSAFSGGGVSISRQIGPQIISNNILGDNIASPSSQSDRGGLTAFSQDSLNFTNNLLAGNTASQRGAGAIIHLLNSETQITNNTLVGNVSAGTYDQATSLGGGMYVETSATSIIANIYNNIVWDNKAAASGDNGADLYIDDATVTTINLYANDFSSITISQGENLYEGGNIDADPKFDADYRLQPGSPCIDTGTSSAPGLPATDLAGNPRVMGGDDSGTAIVDMGAYEWVQLGSFQVTIRPQEAIDAGAQWRRMGTSTWRDSGTTEAGVPVGQHTIEFREISGWARPGNQAVTISPGPTTWVMGTYTTQVGSLQVMISPQAAINAGAQWRVDGGAWHNTEYVQTGLSVDQHLVEFSEGAGWRKPNSQSGTVSEGQTTLVIGNYTAAVPTGSLKVTINPQGAVCSGAKWRRVGMSTWLNSGTTETDVSVGQQTIQFYDVAGWTKPGNQTVTINNGQTTSVTSTYTRQSGSLTVMLGPQEAIDAGAQWRVDGDACAAGNWYGWTSSGSTLAELSVGRHTIEFKNLAGWTKPDNKTVTIRAAQTTTTTGTYTAETQTGSLQVTINPQGAIDAGAQWRCVGTSTWRDGGATETAISVGQYTVEFKDIVNWTKPINQTVTIGNGKTTLAIGTYATTELTGSLQVTISPQGAIDAVGQWRRVGTSTWRDSGTTETGVPVGQQIVEFSEVSGWQRPDNLEVTISQGETTTATGIYIFTPPPGSLQVTISPQGAIDAGAQWRRKGTSTWRDSGTTETGAPAGQQIVEFSEISGWARPGNQAVMISQGRTTWAMGTYTTQVGSLQVMISPQAAINAGAQWRVDGGAWHNTEYVQTGLSVDQHLVEFSEVAGWRKPDNQSVTVSEGQTTLAIGSYAQ